MKPDIVFGLENAGWPAVLLDSTSTICRTNTAAVKAFGAALEGESPRLSTIWSSENSGNPEQFLADWGRSPASKVSLKLRGKGGTTATHDVSICSFMRDGQRFYILQLVPQAAATPAHLKAVEPSAKAVPSPHLAEQARSADSEVLVHKQRLEAALQLARTAALNFNNALTSVLGHTSLLLSGTDPGHPWRNSLLEIEKSATRATEIAGELAAFGRQENERDPRPTGNLNQVLQHAIDSCRQHPAAAGVSWTVQLERSAYSVNFEEAKLQQAFVRILENAAEALPGRGRVSVLTRNLDFSEAVHDGPVHLAVGRYVCVEISDSGCGIPPEALPRIFEPFFSTKGANHRGLGLAWAYGVATNHGGGIAVSSQPGAGTSVRFYLPAEKLAPNAATTPDALQGNETLLMVDDEDLLLTMGKVILSAYGYKVLTAASGQAALDLLSRPENRVDLVITDMVMPAMGGRELIEHIHRLYPGLPILCASGFHQAPQHENGTSFLQKPFTSQQLLLKVKEVLARLHKVDSSLD